MGQRQTGKTAREVRRGPLSMERDESFIAQVRDAQLRRATIALPDRLAELTATAAKLAKAVEELTREIAALQQGTK